MSRWPLFLCINPVAFGIIYKERNCPLVTRAVAAERIQSWKTKHVFVCMCVCMGMHACAGTHAQNYIQQWSIIWEKNEIFMKFSTVTSKEAYILKQWQLHLTVSKCTFVKFTNIKWNPSWGVSLSDNTLSLNIYIYFFSFAFLSSSLSLYKSFLLLFSSLYFLVNDEKTDSHFDLHFSLLLKQ